MTSEQGKRTNANARPRCIIIAGPNGAGKTTFAREFLPDYAKVVRFINADLIASGLSPLKPELASIRAGRFLLSEINKLADSRADFAFESTLSGVSHLPRLRGWQRLGYRIEIIYLTLPSPEIALRRIAIRVKQGGHGVPRTDVVRRFGRSWKNLQGVYLPIADAWMIYDNSGAKPVLVQQGP